jgi:hypothetical protein
MTPAQTVNLTATGAVGGTGKSIRLLGFYVNSTTSGTIAFSGSFTSGTITPAVGWHFFPADAPSGLTATIGGTLNVNFMFYPD